MKIAIVGSRGIPSGYGGFETFVEEISVRLKQHAFDITVICQLSESTLGELKGIKLLYSRYSKASEPLRFYFDSIRMGIKEADMILVCGVGGAVFYPLLKKRKHVLVTHLDGREELRGKYSFLKKKYVKLAQLFAARYSDHLIADGHSVENHWRTVMHVPGDQISAIEFGAEINPETDNAVFERLNLVPGGYFLVVCRMVPENNVEMIVKGYLKSGSRKRLVLVGDTPGAYGSALRLYSSSEIIFTNGIYDKPQLAALREKCFVYIHGHSVGGTNPSLLEAMAAGNICICHDNEFNRETTEGKMLFFKSWDELAEQIIKVEGFNDTERKKYADIAKGRILSYYNWDRITTEYVKLFNALMSK